MQITITTWGKGFEVRATHFLQPQLAVKGGVEFIDFDNGDSEIGLIVGANYRF